MFKPAHNPALGHAGNTGYYPSRLHPQPVAAHGFQRHTYTQPNSSNSANTSGASGPFPSAEYAVTVGAGNGGRASSHHVLQLHRHAQSVSLSVPHAHARQVGFIFHAPTLPFASSTSMMTLNSHDG